MRNGYNEEKSQMEVTEIKRFKQYWEPGKLVPYNLLLIKYFDKLLAIMSISIIVTNLILERKNTVRNNFTKLLVMLKSPEIKLFHYNMCIQVHVHYKLRPFQFGFWGISNFTSGVALGLHDQELHQPAAAQGIDYLSVHNCPEHVDIVI